MPVGMRGFAVLCVVLAACDPVPAASPESPGEGQESPPGPQGAGQEPRPGSQGETLIWPAVVAAEHSLLVYAELEAGEARLTSELALGLAAGYPARLTVAADDGFVISPGCALRPGAVVWDAIAGVEGTAAEARLVDGALVLTAVGEGTAAVTLVGEIADQACDDAGPAGPIRLRHEVVVRVRRVAGFVVETFHQHADGCTDAVVLPADAALWAPTARPVDPQGEAFAAINAPVPVTLTLRSDGALAAGEAGMFSAGVGEVTVLADTELPVAGLRAFTVVGPDALVDVDAALYLQRTAAKGTASEQIVDGGEYRLFFPEERNTVDVRVAAATTTRGPLCAGVPGGWFAATSETPTRCAAIAGEAELDGQVSVAEIRGFGECRVAVTIPGAAVAAWSTWFRATL